MLERVSETYKPASTPLKETSLRFEPAPGGTASSDSSSGVRDTDLLILAVENSELRCQLAELQDQCIELAVDNGALHAEIEALREELMELKTRLSLAS